jgi:hypothetical protein
MGTYAVIMLSISGVLLGAFTFRKALQKLEHGVAISAAIVIAISLLQLGIVVLT